jgi:iron(III) transport system permease protein
MLAPPDFRCSSCFVLFLLVALLTLPVVAVALSWLQFDAQRPVHPARDAADGAARLHGHQPAAVPRVAFGVAVVGMATASAVTLFDFPGRRVFEWALLLPLAMPAYVLAYAYTDFLQYAGPLQTWLRASFGLQGRLLPEVRSLGGAVLVFTVALYPYVYLLARTALSERAVHLMEAARLLGAPLSRRIRGVALPLARPAVAAGVALALMETLADFGVSSYFGIQTFTAGIYKAWLAMDNRIAAAQLATVLLFFVALLLWVEHSAQKRMRFATGRGARAGAQDAAPVQLRGARAAVGLAGVRRADCLGFVLPVLFMLRPLVLGWDNLLWDKFLGWTWNSVRLASLSARWRPYWRWAWPFAVRRNPHILTRAAVQLAGLGYAVPGAVIVVGLLLPVGWLQAAAPQTGAGYWVTATVLGIVWAYLVRFSAVALQSLQSGYSRIPVSLDDSARMLGTGGPGHSGARALAAAQAFGRGGRAAGVCRRDEGTARHAGAAALQQRHPGRRHLPAGARRAPRRGRLARAGPGAGRPAAGGAAQPHAALQGLSHV